MSSTQFLSKIPDVSIDDSGNYKYILIKLTDQNDPTHPFKYVVRGGEAFGYHVDIYDNFKAVEKLDEHNITCKMMGGGWLQHGDNSIRVEGASMQFGPADHSISAGVLRKEFPTMKITFEPPC